MDRTPLKCHFSEIVSASATKSGSDVELIDPFQLINWMDKMPEKDKQDHEAIEQKLQTAKDKELPSGIDMVL